MVHVVSPNYALVITTINYPTDALLKIRDGAARLPAQLHVIGDVSSPHDFSLSGASYLDMAAQDRTGFRFASLCPQRHYARKNIGYLAAIQNGATIIIETDDDNIPLDSFWEARKRIVSAPLVNTGTWCNVYRYFTSALIWPRGLPLDHIADSVPELSAVPVTDGLDCPIQQGLANGNPDVDAIYRLVLSLPQSFTGGQIALDKGVWCPFNSQNTSFWRPAFPLLYLPYFCSFRMTDIWRSFVAQRIAWENGWRVLFHGPTVFQDRNQHDLMRDFSDEVPGYLNNDRIRRTLEDVALRGGEAAIGDDMLACYRSLIALELIDRKEEELLNAWLHDISALQQLTPSA